MLKEWERRQIQSLHKRGDSLRRIEEITHHHRKTIRKILDKGTDGGALKEDATNGQNLKRKQSGRLRTLESFKEFLQSETKKQVCTAKLLMDLRELGFSGSLRSLQRFLHSTNDRPTATAQQNWEWMQLVVQGARTDLQIKQDIGEFLMLGDVIKLQEHIRSSSLRGRNRALSVLAHGKEISMGRIAGFLCITPRTVRQYLSEFNEKGVVCVMNRSRKEIKKAADPNYTSPVFKTIHTPPSAFGINRTTWRMDDLYAVLSNQGVRISRFNIRKIIKDAGYRFRKAKTVLTSTDPEYREKLQNITQILANLALDEKFFSIDEFGPFSVKIQGGRNWAKPEENRSVPQYQKGKGSLIITAALELSTNQITHFYSEKKNTDEMIRLLELLISQYRSQTRIFFSWDAASWHGSSKFSSRVDEINDATYRAEHGTPVVSLAPLPSCAQFLNVIESVFSGMARAIIHNSNYESVDATKAAIDRYFAERNENFQKHPRRAGKKLWGKERVKPEFNEANNCKDPRF
jgi:transposase